MTTSDSPPPLQGPSGFRVEQGAVRRRFGVRLTLAGLGVGSLAVLAWSVTLTARSPSSSTAPLPSATEGSPAAAQPSISWSSDSLELILSPGDTASRTLTFTSSVELRDIRVEPVPAIAPFVTVTPNTFANIPANTPQSVTLNFAITPAAGLGDYFGTIHARTRNQTLPHTLKAVVHIWQRIPNNAFGITFRFPPKWIASIEANGVDLYAPEAQQYLQTPEHYTPPTVAVRVLPNPSLLPVREFALAEDSGWYSAYLEQGPIALDGFDAFYLSDVPAVSARDPALAIFVGVGDQVFLIMGGRSSAESFLDIAHGVSFD